MTAQWIPSVVKGGARSRQSQKFTDIIDRIERFRVHVKLNKSQFSMRIGIKPQTYNNFIGAQGSKPSVELIHGIVTQFGVNPMWILTGNGSMHLDSPGRRVARAAEERAAKQPDRSEETGSAAPAEVPPEFAALLPILDRIETVLAKTNNPRYLLLDRLVDALKQYARVDPPGSARDLQQILEHVERQIAVK
jgi:DNA-binding XRE family transcriptional regulator